MTEPEITFYDLKRAQTTLQPLIDKLNPHQSIIITVYGIRVVSDDIELPFDENGIGFEVVDHD